MSEPDEAKAVPRVPRVSLRVLAWILGVLFVLILGATGGNLYITLTRTAAACSFYKDLAGLPVTIVAGQNKPAQLGVAIIAHSREAFRRSGCTGPLPPPSASFAKWAPYYHLPAG